MARDIFEDATSLHSSPAPETELPAPVQFEVQVRVPLVYTIKVKATSTAKAYDLARDLSWPRDFVPAPIGTLPGWGDDLPLSDSDSTVCLFRGSQQCQRSLRNSGAS
jgi:hypothetical protein